jgi:hypothetical protein
MMRGIRILDVDDLAILSAFASGNFRTKDMAWFLGLTPPAISHRLNKYRRHLPGFEEGQPTPRFLAFCRKAQKALDVLLDYKDVA